MAIYLDDAPVNFQGDHLDAVLNEAQQFLQAHGRIVVEVRVDGRTLSSEELTHTREQPIGSSEWRLYSADPASLAMSILRQMQPMLDQTRQQLHNAAGHFQSDRPREGLREIGQGMEIWQQLPQALIRCAGLLKISPDQVVHQDQTLPQAAVSLTEQLKSLRDKVWASDTIALADQLAYEWPATIDRWDGLIIALADRIQSQTNIRSQPRE